MLEQKYLNFFFDLNFDDFDFLLLLLLKVTKVGDRSCVLVLFSLFHNYYLCTLEDKE